MSKLRDYTSRKAELETMLAGDEKDNLIVVDVFGWNLEDDWIKKAGRLEVSFSTNPDLIPRMEAFIEGLGDVGMYTCFCTEKKWRVEVYDESLSSFDYEPIITRWKITHADALATAILLLMLEREMKKG